MPRSPSLALRLTLFFSIVSAAVLLMLGYLIGRSMERHLEEQDLAALDGKLELVRHLLAKAQSAGDWDAVAGQLDDALVGHHGLAVAIIGPDGRVLFTSSGIVFPRGVLESRPTHGAPRAMVWQQGDHSYRGIAAATSTLVAGKPATVTVALAVDIGEHQDFMAAFHKNLWAMIVGGILLIVVLGWIAARRGLAPVHHIAAISRGISADRLGSRLPIDTVPAELVDLANAFNEMLARLEDSFRRLSDFSSDLAHELRTPVTNLTTQTQVALTGKRSAEALREVLYSNLEEYNRLSRMIEDMLFLAKSDNGLIVLRSETIELAAEVQKLFEFYEAFAEERGVGLTRVGNGTVQGDKLMLRRAISNLLSNALQHTPRGSAVSVRIDRLESGEVRLTVENPGEQIPPEHLSRLFDRFYRVDFSRRAASGGAGLGLAILKSIIAAHQGKILVSSVPESTRFEIIFPANV